MTIMMNGGKRINIYFKVSVCLQELSSRKLLMYIHSYSLYANSWNILDDKYIGIFV